ncbi:hypothetical protein BGZ79_009184 [Entomortierella chlamydospora]|nr:hypothetical protein BGZ79_009184 [Entomortierella chlamydospora]
METLLTIASLTKAFTATAIGELITERKMDWDITPVKSYLPVFELMDPVLTSQLAMVDLLSHRTNLPNAGELAWYRSTAEIRDLVKKLRHVNMSSKLGSKCQYSGVMYGVAGEAAANVAGISYEKLVETKVLEPLKLKNTGFKPMKLEKISLIMAESIEDAQKGLFAMCPVDYIGKANISAGDLQGLEGLLPKRIPKNLASQDLKAFEGEYTNPVLGDMTVRVEIDENTEKETLLFKMGPFDRKLEYYHFDSFVGIIKDWNMTATDLTTFRNGRDGKVEGLRFFEEEFKRKNERTSP